MSVKLCKACGSKTHSHTTSKDCPYNKKNQHIDNPDNPVDDGGLPEDAASSDSPDDTSSDDSSIMEDLIFGCTCGSWTRAHKIDCPLNSRNRYAKRDLFPEVEVAETFKLGEYCALHWSRMGDKHLICRVIQICRDHYRLYCRSGILSENFSSSDLMTCPKGDIPMDKWRQSFVISLMQGHP